MNSHDIAKLFTILPTSVVIFNKDGVIEWMNKYAKNNGELTISKGNNINNLHQSGNLLSDIKDGVKKGEKDVWFGTINYKNSPQTSNGVIYAVGKNSKNYIFIESTKAQTYDNKETKRRYDATTKLPSQDEVFNLLKYAVQDNDRFTILVIRIENYYDIHRAYGRKKAEFLIKQLAKDFDSKLPPQCLLGRWDSDHFVVTVPGKYKYRSIIEDFNIITGTPYQLGEKPVYYETNIGSARYPKHSKDTEELFSFAESALHIASQDNEKNDHMYQADEHNRITAHITKSNVLKEAVENEELLTYYQPQIEPQTGTVRGCEALIRWGRTDQTVAPSEFIDLLEKEASLIKKAGKDILTNAVKEAQSWQKQFNEDLIISVNLSIEQLRSSEFVSQVDSVLDNYQFDAQNLEFEITESIAIDSMEEIKNTIRSISKRGINIAIDDFGTGYSGYNYLVNFPSEIIKIDASFIRQITRNKKVVDMVKNIIELGERLGVDVVAEGVEEKEELDLLQKWGCRYIQGYYYARPLPKNDIAPFLSQYCGE